MNDEGEFKCYHDEIGECTCDGQCEPGQKCVDMQCVEPSMSGHIRAERISSVRPLNGRYSRIAVDLYQGLAYAVVEGPNSNIDSFQADPWTYCARDDAIGMEAGNSDAPDNTNRREFCDAVLNQINRYTPFGGNPPPSALQGQWPRGPAPHNDDKINNPGELGPGLGTTHKARRMAAQNAQDADDQVDFQPGWRWDQVGSNEGPIYNMADQRNGQFRNIEQTWAFADNSLTDAVHVIDFHDMMHPTIIDRWDTGKPVMSHEHSMYAYVDVAVSHYGTVAVLQRRRWSTYASQTPFGFGRVGFTPYRPGSILEGPLLPLEDDDDDRDHPESLKSWWFEEAGRLPVHMAFSKETDSEFLAVANHGLVGFPEERGSIFIYETDGPYWEVTFDAFAVGNQREFEYCLGGDMLVSDAVYHGTEGPPGKWPFYAHPVHVTWNGYTVLASLGANNLIAVIEVFEEGKAPEIAGIMCLGMKDFMAEENKLDSAIADNTILLRNMPVSGLYQPDGMVVFKGEGGVTNIITANSGFFHVEDVVPLADLDIDGNALGVDAEWLKKLENAGQLWTLKSRVAEGFFHAPAWYGVGSAGYALRRQGPYGLGGASLYDTPQGFSGVAPAKTAAPTGSILIPGARSISMWKFSTAGISKGSGVFQQWWDSGSDFEESQEYNTPNSFNAINHFDDASTMRGPRPARVVKGYMYGQTFLFVSLLQGHSIEMYTVSDDGNEVDYYDSLSYVDASPLGEILGGDYAPYDLVFLESRGPSCPALMVSHPGGLVKGSGNIAVWAFKQDGYYCSEYYYGGFGTE
eukprot:TRINITY_DN85677_c0_g1_i1.p1 TRINITY_DN85677_c0_g1~~TRINITY_DN85677_c0_g1_i1.p1  ORF type:complete len:912 (-),score=94.92 TRINITY_DN85677_c0_g1_i1:33-2435(-)